VNVKGKVIDVQGGRDVEGNKVQVYKRNGSKAQKWSILYVDKKGKEMTKGLNKDFGF
jgi:hypothetical protein